MTSAFGCKTRRAQANDLPSLFSPRVLHVLPFAEARESCSGEPSAAFALSLKIDYTCSFFKRLRANEYRHRVNRPSDGAVLHRKALNSSTNRSIAIDDHVQVPGGISRRQVLVDAVRLSFFFQWHPGSVEFSCTGLISERASVASWQVVNCMILHVPARQRSRSSQRPIRPGRSYHMQIWLALRLAKIGDASSKGSECSCHQ